MCDLLCFLNPDMNVSSGSKWDYFSVVIDSFSHNKQDSQMAFYTGRVEYSKDIINNK